MGSNPGAREFVLPNVIVIEIIYDTGIFIIVLKSYYYELYVFNIF
jgi:hypothetical protein